MKAAIRSVAARAYWSSPHFLSHVKGHVLILMYHRVLPREEIANAFVQPGMYVTPETFESHLDFLTTHFTLLPFEDLLARWEENAWDPAARYCTVTFDDGWVDNYTYAFPLLQAYGAPATIFLAAELIGTSDWLWFDKLGHLLTGLRDEDAIDSLIEGAKRLPDDAREEWLAEVAETSGARPCQGRRFLNWNEVREMSRHGISFGSHTCTHRALSRLTGEVLRRELSVSSELLRRQQANYVPVLSYPYGDYSEQVIAEARTAGYRAAVSTRPGRESGRPADLFRLRRIEVHDDVACSIPLLALHVARQTRAALGADA